MTKDEKLLLIADLLKDVRGNFTDPEERVKLARKLAEDLDRQDIIDDIDYFLDNLEEDGDGRFFRDTYDRIFEKDLRNFTTMWEDLPEDFKEIHREYMTFPDISRAKSIRHTSYAIYAGNLGVCLTEKCEFRALGEWHNDGYSNLPEDVYQFVSKEAIMSESEEY